jgi:FMN reductase (NADPH)
MNKVIETLLEHRSIRKFNEKQLTKEQIEIIVKSAQSASTSSFVQAYSMIGIKDPQKKKMLAKLAGDQPYVEKNGHFFLFCADLYRHECIGERANLDFSETLESTEKFMVAVIDATLAAQNAAVAAESMGLGICYIGGIRNNLNEVSQLLNLPNKVVPLFGLAVGEPDHMPEKKPRLPIKQVYFEEEYIINKEVTYSHLDEYDEMISEYYQSRTKSSRSETWSNQIEKKMSNPVRLYVKDYLKKQGFPLK